MQTALQRCPDCRDVKDLCTCKSVPSAHAAVVLQCHKLVALFAGHDSTKSVRGKRKSAVNVHSKYQNYTRKRFTQAFITTYAVLMFPDTSIMACTSSRSSS